MQSSRLKNIIILILALTNLFLLAALTVRSTEEQSSHRQASQELVALFEKVSITLDEAVIPSGRAPEGRLLTRDEDLDQKVAQHLLGRDLTREDRGGGILAYAGSGGGSIQFRTSGAFDASGPFEGDQDPEAFCRSFCRAFDYQDLTFSLAGGSGTAAARQVYDSCPVINCTITFTITEGRVTAISGTHLPDTYTGVYTGPDGSGPISAVTALTTFLDARRQIGAVVSAVTEVYACYELQSSAASPMTLVPTWCIVTDIGYFYVNCYTSAVTYQQGY